MFATHFGEKIEIVGCSFDDDDTIAKVHFKCYSQYQQEYCGATQYTSLMDVKADGDREELIKYLQSFKNLRKDKTMKTATTGSAKHTPDNKDKSLKELTADYNSKVKPSDRIKTFRDRPTALRRLAKVSGAKPSKGKKMEPNVIKLVGKKSSVAGKYLYKVAKVNPRRAGTHGWKSYELLQDGMTYEQFVAQKGAGSKHLTHDIKKGWVEARANPKA